MEKRAFTLIFFFKKRSKRSLALVKKGLRRKDWWLSEPLAYGMRSSVFHLPVFSTPKNQTAKLMITNMKI